MLRRYVHSIGIALLIVGMLVFNPRLTAIAAAGPEASASGKPETKETLGAKDVAAEYQAENITRQAKAELPPPVVTRSGGKTLLYGGIAAAAVVGAVALAAGSGGGGSSSEEEEVPEEPKKNPVGANLAGDNWYGRLILVDSGFKEDVTATVEQDGANLVITTSSAQKYGKKFIGHIERDGYIQVRDQDTGQDWTTYYDKARWNMIDLYDYVHEFHDMDRLYLTRISKE
ncbi:hypothetical protein JWG42_01840 [Desulfoprunum benzoelyticum]|uniref:Uncharacterized protein n=1 Tax=Desulfoprunum benzoelyticum TaxID=1506996 RepID=A0A840UV33_9BACT|nr:hypothetical protein [Desulfoprunum benzoelyticum]MBB5346578.1 hypothetical protein [Desulfoprunum benzoelyticum]MBM9528893.1 hypothetical protein [Desulfoprunum benzoelyticum]